MPVYLLTDSTASACEHLALALKATNRATLVGNTTRGAGHFGSTRPFAAGNLEVFLPVGRTYDPATGRDWEGAGIEPDVSVPAERALHRALAELGADPALAEEISPKRGGPRATDVRDINHGGPGYGFGITPPRGGETFLEVMLVQANAAAAMAGVLQGDRIVAMNGLRVADMDPATIIKALRPPRLELQILRSGRTLEVKMALE